MLGPTVRSPTFLSFIYSPLFSHYSSFLPSFLPSCHQISQKSADLNGLVRCAERPILFSARVPSHSERALPECSCTFHKPLCLCILQSSYTHHQHSHLVTTFLSDHLRSYMFLPLRGKLQAIKLFTIKIRFATTFFVQVE